MKKLASAKSLVCFKTISYSIELISVLLLVLYSVFAGLKDQTIINEINKAMLGQLPLMVFIPIVLPLIILSFDLFWLIYKSRLVNNTVIKPKLSMIAKIFYLDMLNYQAKKFNKFLYKNLFWLIMVMFAGASMLLYLGFGVKFTEDGTIHFNSTWTNVPLAISGCLYFVIVLIISLLYIWYFIGGFKIADYEIRKSKDFIAAKKKAHQKELNKVKSQQLKNYYFLNLIDKSEYKLAIKSQNKKRPKK